MSRFQSSPVPKDGRYRLRDRLTILERRVSILARPEGRALRAEFGNHLGQRIVSILARPEGRALLTAALPLTDM